LLGQRRGQRYALFYLRVPYRPAFLSCAAFPGRRWVTGRHQATDLAVEASSVLYTAAAMNKELWRKRMERTERVLDQIARKGSGVVLACVICLGPVGPRHDGSHDPPGVSSLEKVAVLPSEDDGLHDHRETPLVVARLVTVAEISVTGAALLGEDPSP
jgi:hypothetical protein